MITQLQARNFKSWRDTGELSLTPLTGLFGTNSSGKTSILQILLMLKQTVESSDRKRVLHTGDDRSLVDLGTFSDLIYDHQSNASLRLSLSWKLPTPLLIRDPEARRMLFNIQALSFCADVSTDAIRPIVESFAYSFEYFKFGMRRTSGGNGAARGNYELVDDGYATKRVPGRPWPLPSPVKCYGFPDEATGYYQNTGFLPDFVLAFEGLLSRMTYWVRFANTLIVAMCGPVSDPLM